jgi:hypothetical protein
MPKYDTRKRRGSAKRHPISGVERDDHYLLTFAISWLPYGGAPEDEILIRFGLDRTRYLARVLETVHRQRAHIHPDTAERLIGMCTSIDRQHS